MTLQESKALMTDAAMSKLHEVVEAKPFIDTSHKVNNDIVMTALCKAVGEGVIKPSAINERLQKLLNSETNTVSQSKLTEILQSIRRVQPNMICRIRLLDTEFRVLREWDYVDSANFLRMFAEVLTYYEITPSDVRKKLTETLKSTIVNNVSQLVSKYYKSDEIAREGMVISVSTVQRLVNMSGGILQAEFIEV